MTFSLKYLHYNQPRLASQAKLPDTGGIRIYHGTQVKKIAAGILPDKLKEGVKLIPGTEGNYGAVTTIFFSLGNNFHGLNSIAAAKRAASSDPPALA
jgi:hypothetical protein